MKNRNSLLLAGVTSLVTFTLLASLVVGCAKPTLTSPAPTRSASSSATAKTTSPVDSKPNKQAQLEAAAQKEGSVAYWASIAIDADKYLLKFKQRYPWLKVDVWQADNQLIIEKVRGEAAAGQYNADLMGMSSDYWSTFDTSLLADYEWANASYYPPDTFVRKSVMLAYVIPMGAAYNSKLVTGDKVPKAWEDMKDPKWKGKTAASLSSRDAPLMLAALWGSEGKLNWDKSFSFWRDVFKETKPRSVNLYTGPVKLLGAGEFELFVYSPANVPIKEKLDGGLPTDAVPFSPVPSKTTGFGILKNAPHPNAARLLADWLTSAEGATEFSEVMFYPSLHKSASARVDRAFKEKAMNLYLVNPSVFTAENFEKSTAFWNELMQANK
ncbi:MAG: extracellular solute-binding protein [Chloroflexi bacterium]|nr:extracellular solute-binding protein [Chloroflexota bacterium]